MSLQNPTPVVIVRPSPTGTPWAEVISDFLSGIASIAFSAWVMMLLVPVAVPDWRPGYWQTMAGLLVVRSATASGEWRLWTRRHPLSKRAAK